MWCSVKLSNIIKPTLHIQISPIARHKYWLVVSTPLKNIMLSVGVTSPNMEKCSKPPTSLSSEFCGLSHGLRLHLPNVLHWGSLGFISSKLCWLKTGYMQPVFLLDHLKSFPFQLNPFPILNTTQTKPWFSIAWLLWLGLLPRSKNISRDCFSPCLGTFLAPVARKAHGEAMPSVLQRIDLVKQTNRFSHRWDHSQGAQAITWNCGFHKSNHSLLAPCIVTLKKNKELSISLCYIVWCYFSIFLGCP